MMAKKVHFLIDDVIWVLRDLTRDRPASVFDHPLLATLKKCHERAGLKVQLNLFYRTDSFYGEEEFTLADMTDAYREEWASASDWLRMAFHAKEEWPDYPYVNATYEDVYRTFRAVEREVFRFAGEGTFTYGYCPHFNSVSLAGVKALYDCGVRVMDVSAGDAVEYDEATSTLSGAHYIRLLHNRQPETRVYTRGGKYSTTGDSLCSYNHLSTKQLEETLRVMDTVFDEKTGMHFKKFHLPIMTVNMMELDEIESTMAPFMNDEYVGVCTHEQYVHSHYFAHQPDWAEKLEKMAEVLYKNGYTHIFAEEILEK